MTATRSRHRARDQATGAASYASLAVGALAAIVFIALVIQTFAGATQIGVSTDEPGHQQRMNQWFATGWYLPPNFFENGEVKPEISTGRLHAYGGAFSMFGHVIAVLAGAETWGATAHSAAAYNARGIAVALLGLAAALAVGYALLVTYRRWTIALWAAAATFAIPLWTGYSMFAVKDIPPAAGWTMITSALVVALHPRPRWRRPLTIGLMCLAGVWFAVGTRPALWLPLALTAIVFAVLVAKSPVGKQLARNVVAALAGALIGVVAIAALHYRNAAVPLEWLASAVRTSGDFHWTGTTLSAGQLVSEKPPWWYLPAWVGGSMPILLGLLAAVGLVLVVARVLRGWTLNRPDAGLSLWAMQALFLPTVATIAGSTMYAGLRQHLYVLPALAALAGVAAYAASRRFQTGWPNVVVATGLIAALVVPAWEQARLFPYNFVYKNPVAGPVNDRWEADMHWVSGREALTRVPSGEPAYCYSQSIRPDLGDAINPSIRRCDRHLQISAFMEEQGRTAAPADTADDVWVIARRYRGSPPAPECEEVDSVTRELRGEDVIMSYVLRCDPGVVDD
jgi:hypothetical protein